VLEPWRGIPTAAAHTVAHLGDDAGRRCRSIRPHRDVSACDPPVHRARSSAGSAWSVSATCRAIPRGNARCAASSCAPFARAPCSGRRGSRVLSGGARAPATGARRRTGAERLARVRPLDQRRSDPAVACGRRPNFARATRTRRARRPSRSVRVCAERVLRRRRGWRARAARARAACARAACRARSVRAPARAGVVGAARVESHARLPIGHAPASRFRTCPARFSRDGARCVRRLARARGAHRSRWRRARHALSARARAENRRTPGARSLSGASPRRGKKPLTGCASLGTQAAMTAADVAAAVQSGGAVALALVVYLELRQIRASIERLSERIAQRVSA